MKEFGSDDFLAQPAIDLRPEANNLTLVRLVLASLVIVTHSYWRATGVEGADWLSPVLGKPLSVFAVDGFFFLSGFLVFRSLQRQPAIGRFMLARLTRMFPALFVAVAAIVAGGLFFTQAASNSYFTGETLRFVAGNLSFVKGYYTLTGVMCGAEPCNVNGSLWTLPWEMRCYLLLAALALSGLATTRMMTWVVVPLSAAFAIAWQVEAVPIAAADLIAPSVVYYGDQIARLWSMFAAGCAALIFHRHMSFNGWAVLALLVVACLPLPGPLALVAHVAFVSYGVLYCGFVKLRATRLIGRMPDYSYGIYIYAFPVMMLIWAARPTIEAPALAALNFLAVMPIAALSWHFVEKPALDRFRARRSTHREIPDA